MLRHHLLLLVIIFKTILTTSIHTERKGENKKGNLKMYYLYCEGFYIMAILFFHFNYSLKAFKIQGRESQRRYFSDIVGCNYDSNNVIVIGKGNSDMLDQWLFTCLRLLGCRQFGRRRGDKTLACTWLSGLPLWVYPGWHSKSCFSFCSFEFIIWVETLAIWCSK